MMEEINRLLAIRIGPVTVDQLTDVAIIVLVIWGMVRLTERFADRAMARARIERSLFTFIKSTLKAILIAIAALLAASALGISITSLLALMGVVGLAISLSVQNTLMNLMGGVLVLATKPFIVGDYIQTGGSEGTVLDVGLIYTQIATADDKIIFLPNSGLSSGQIVNFTRSRKRRLDLSFSAVFDADPDAVRARIFSALDDARILSDPAPLVKIAGYSEAGVSFAVKVWVATADYWDVLYDVNERVGRAFRDAGIRMPGRQYEVSLRDRESKD